jgi:hypothetical protein
VHFRLQSLPQRFRKVCLKCEWQFRVASKPDGARAVQCVGEPHHEHNPNTFLRFVRERIVQCPGQSSSAEQTFCRSAKFAPGCVTMVLTLYVWVQNFNLFISVEGVTLTHHDSCPQSCVCGTPQCCHHPGGRVSCCTHSVSLMLTTCLFPTKSIKLAVFVPSLPTSECHSQPHRTSQLALSCSKSESKLSCAQGCVYARPVRRFRQLFVPNRIRKQSLWVCGA